MTLSVSNVTIVTFLLPRGQINVTTNVLCHEVAHAIGSIWSFLKCVGKKDPFRKSRLDSMPRALFRTNKLVTGPACHGTGKI